MAIDQHQDALSEPKRVGDDVSGVLARLRLVREAIYTSGVMRGASGALRPVWPAGLTRDRGEFLRDAAMSINAASIVETGLGLAMSSSYLLEAALRSAARPAPRLTSIDPGEASVNDDAGLLHLADAGLTPFHRFFPEHSQRVLPLLAQSGETFDLAFLDGDHRFDGAFVDAYYALQIVRPGGLIILDDVWMASVRKVSRFLTSNGLCELASEHASGGKPRLHVLRPLANHAGRAWDHFADF
jgi:predicted O-methyltransferase YrrM